MAASQVIAISGASGLVGRALTKSLTDQGHLVRQLVRRPVQDSDQEIYWKPSTGEIDASELNGVDAVVHLAGANIAGQRWTDEFKKTIVDSRVQGTRLLAQTIASLDQKPAVFVSASATGFYGDRGDESVDENSSAGDNFLAETCQLWEAAAVPAAEAGIRVVHPRIGIVLSPEGGALEKMLPLFRWGAGGVLGSGRQYMSWLTRDELVNVIEFLIETPEAEGPINAVTPQPVTNREFTKTLGRVLGKPTVLPAPAFALKLAMGQMADELLLASTNVVPAQLQSLGYEFEHPQLDAAFRSIL